MHTVNISIVSFIFLRRKADIVVCFFLIYIYIYIFFFLFYIFHHSQFSMYSPSSALLALCLFLYFSTCNVYAPTHKGKKKKPFVENLLGNKLDLIAIRHRLVKICASFITDFGRQRWWIIQVHNILCWRQRTFKSHGLNCFKPVQLINKNNIKVIKSINKAKLDSHSFDEVRGLQRLSAQILSFFAASICFLFVLSLIHHHFLLYSSSSFFPPLFCLHC